MSFSDRKTNAKHPEEKKKSLPLEKVDELSQFNIMRFLNDTDVSHLAVNKSFAAKIQHENRWKNKLRQALFRGIYQQRLLDMLGEGRSIVSDTKEEETTLQYQVNAEIEKIFAKCTHWKITNFQSIYARLKKLDGNYLNEDELILLSGNVAATRDWLEKNQQRIKRQEFLDLKGFCPIHYIALTGNVEVMRLYQLFGDVKVKSRGSGGAEMMASLSGRVAAMSFCAKEYKLDMKKKNYFTWGIEHSSAKSGNLAALRACKNIFKIKKRMVEDPQVLQLVAEHGSEEMLIHWVETLKKIPESDSTTVKLLNVPYLAARAGNSATIEASVVVDLDLELKRLDDMSVLHAAAQSGKVGAFETCKKFIGPLIKTSVPITYCAGLSGNIAMLRYWRDLQFTLNKPYELAGVEGPIELHHAVAEKGGLEEMKFCQQIGLDIKKPQQNGANILHIAAKSGNSTLIREHEKAGVDIYAVDNRGRGLLHYASEGNDPFTLLSCVELGLDLSTIKDGSINDFIDENCDPAMLILFKILNIPIGRILHELSYISENKLTRNFALTLITPSVIGHDDFDIEAEWNKCLSITNMSARLARFFENMCNLKVPPARFFSKHYVSKTSYLRQLAENLGSMQDKGLVDLYIHLIYSLLRGVTTTSISAYNDKNLVFCMIFASNRVLQQIHANRLTWESSVKQSAPQSLVV